MARTVIEINEKNLYKRIFESQFFTRFLKKYFFEGSNTKKGILLWIIYRTNIKSFYELFN